MKELYLCLINILSTINALKWIDLDKGQLTATTRPAIAFPACLIKMEIVKAENQTRTTQILELRVTIRLVFTYLGETALQTPETIRNQSLEYLDTCQAVYLAIQTGLNHQNRPFERLSQTEQEADGIKVVNMLFKTVIFDQSAD